MILSGAVQRSSRQRLNELTYHQHAINVMTILDHSLSMFKNIPKLTWADTLAICVLMNTIPGVVPTKSRNRSLYSAKPFILYCLLLSMILLLMC